MANPWSGEVALVIDGRRRVMKLTLGALAELEAALQSGSLVELVQRNSSNIDALVDRLHAAARQRLVSKTSM